MICIGLDLATRRTGCCVLDGEKLVYHECIRANEKYDFRSRIRYVGEKLEFIINEFLPEKMFIEDAPIIKNSSASMLLIMQGYILAIADKHKIPVEIFQPSSWRKTIGIVGKNGKEALEKDKVKQATVDYVNERFGLQLTYKKDSIKSEDDIADAIGIACCGIMR
jgi:Holliday junction resolvasome RuvABC endonuclease subunit